MALDNWLATLDNLPRCLSSVFNFLSTTEPKTYRERLEKLVKISENDYLEKQELIRKWDSERELFYNIAHVDASAYAHWMSS